VIGEKEIAIGEIQGNSNNEIEMIKGNALREIENAKRNAEIKINAAGDEIMQAKLEAQQSQNKAREDSIIFAEVIANFVRFKDEGISPLSSMAEELEAEYGFSNPGKALAAARKYSKNLVKQKNAAVCKDRDDAFCNEACIFIIDVFNHYFDAITAKATYDNYSSILQQVREVYDTINARCRALINTSILKEYYQAREKELKALNVVLGLRERDRAEQREIREQMKDEERARREAERVLREAAKMKAENERKEAELQARLDLATGAEREKYEAILSDLRAKIKEQEDRELQAKSLAEFTKRGHVYIISNVGSFGEDVLKIGMTRRLVPEDRVMELGGASVPFPFDIHAMIPTEDAPKLESDFHAAFTDRMINKVNTRKEFFRVSIDEIRRFLNKEGIDINTARFTMKAEAREYRESQAIDALPGTQREKELQRILECSKDDMAHGDDLGDVIDE
jgi:hypothetical protein